MKEYSKKSVFIIILGIYCMCGIVKNIEFLVLKTDQTILAENIICKLFCLVMIATVLTILGLKWKDIGFKRTGFFKGMKYGFSLGIVTFTIAYGFEFLILLANGKHPKLQFFITNFTMSEQNITGLSGMVLLICLFGNVINVWAEEGLFRGLLLKLGSNTYGQKKANILQALLFGIWHLVSVIQWVMEGSMTVPQAIVFGIGYVALAWMLAFEWGICASVLGTVWMGVFEHFFNNFISNALHTVTETGVDELQIVRIVLSNVLSLIIVIILARKQKGQFKLPPNSYSLFISSSNL